MAKKIVRKDEPSDSKLQRRLVANPRKAVENKGGA
jgi:hypothetical protein